MGAWGYGILQNDTAQDGIVEISQRIQSDITALSLSGSEDEAAEIGAATGLLLQFSPYSFNPENEFHESLIRALTVPLLVQRLIR